MKELEGKDLAYWERNQLVCYLSKIYPAWLEKHPEDPKWEKEWFNIVFIQFPEDLASWHIHDSEIKYFGHLQCKEGDSWNGLTLYEKYALLLKKNKELPF